MPEEVVWTSFFDVECALDRLLGPGQIHGNIIEFGCGYGTFTLAAAHRTKGVVTALDIEPEMVATVQDRARSTGATNVSARVRDFVEAGTGLDDGTQAHAMIYNLLHLENPVALLQEAHRVLRASGTLSVIHWRSDIPTPRGPPHAIRPRPEQCHGWISQAGFRAIERVDLRTCCPYHFGLVALR